MGPPAPESPVPAGEAAVERIELAAEPLSGAQSPEAEASIEGAALSQPPEAEPSESVAPGVPALPEGAQARSGKSAEEAARTVSVPGESAKPEAPPPVERQEELLREGPAPRVPLKEAPAEAPAAQPAELEAATAEAATAEAATAEAATAEAKQEAGDTAAALAQGLQVTAGEESGGMAAVPAAGGGGAAAEAGMEDGGLAAWKARTAAAIEGVPEPEAVDAQQVSGPLRQHAGTSVERITQGTGALHGSLVAARPKPPEPDPPIPPVLAKSEKPDLVPEATALLTAAATRPLPEQTVPALSESPQHHMPVIQLDEAGRLSFIALTKADYEAARAKKAAPQAEQRKEDEAQRQKLDKAKAAAKEEPKPGPRREGDVRVLGAEAPTTVPAAPKPFVPGEAYARQVTLGNVAAMLLADVDAQGKAILQSGREAAFPPRKPLVMLDEFKTLGEELAVSTTRLLDQRLRVIADEVGVTGDKLDKMIALRKQQLAEQKAQTTENLLAEVNKADAALEEAGGQKKKAIEDTRKAVDEDTEEKLVAARGERDPQVVTRRRDRMLDKVNADAGHATVAYEKLGKVRAEALSREEAVRGRAYEAAAKKDEETLLANVGTSEEERKKALVSVMESRAWARKKIGEISQLKTEAAAAVKERLAGVERALPQARELIRQWAAAMQGEERSWWTKLWEQVSDWFSQTAAVSASWEKERTKETADAVIASRGQLESLKVMVQQGTIDPASKESLDKLSGEQKAIVKSYFSEGPDKGNAIAAVAAGMRARLAAERFPELAKQLEDLALDTSDWRALGKLAAAIRPGFNVQAVVSDLWKALDQWGTDEDAVYRALSGLSPLENKIVHKAYLAIHGRELDEHIRDEFSDAEQERALALARGEQAKADAAALREAMKGGLTGAGTDEKLIMSTLRNKTPEERAAIRAAYEAEYGARLEDDLKDELGGDDKDQAEAHLAGETARADAIAVNQAMRGGWFFGLGTDRGEIEAVYKRTRDEVLAEAARHPEWTTAEVEAEISRRNGELSKEFGAKYARDYGVPADKALEAAYQSELSGAELDLVTALDKNDLVAADAARVRIETDSTVYASDSALNAVLKDQYRRGLEEAKRDKTADFLRRRDSANPPWDAQELKRQQELLKQGIELAARELGARNMAALTQKFDAKYQDLQDGGFTEQLADSMSGHDRAQATDLVQQGGYLSPAQEAHYAMAGVGTDEEALKKVFDGKTRKEIEELRKEYKRLYGKDLDEDVQGETSGREQFDLTGLLKGKPESPEEAIQRLKEKRKYEQEQMGLGNLFARDEMRLLDEEIAALEKDAKDLERGDMSAEERQLKEELFYGYSVKAAERAVEDHRAAVDTVTDTAAQVATVVVLVVVVVAATIATAGAAGVGFAAALGTVMSSASMMAGATAASVIAGIGTKALMRGADYYASGDIVTDAALGVVDVATAGLTANMGGKLLGEGLKAGTKLGGLARMAQSSSRATRMAAHMVAQGTEGLVSSLPAAIVGNLTNDRNWEGDAFSNILTGIGTEAGIATFVAGGLGALGGIAKPRAKSLATMAAEERHLLIQGYQRSHPGASLAKLDADLAAGRIAGVDQQALDAFKKELHGNLMDGVPTGLRDQFRDVQIKMLGDAEFEAFTKSGSARAVVILEEGKPTVILREGADPSVLREEGVHLAQLADPKTAGLFRQLDEVNLANWENLSLTEQLELYRVKLEVEVDAQQRLLSNLEGSLATAESAAAREALEGERRAIKDNLDNLLERVDEVDAISPAERLRISQGLEPRPQYLEQRPRLFNKKARPGLEFHEGELLLRGVEVHDSPLSKQQKGRVYQAGAPFEEKGRTYRLVVQLDEKGTIVKRREEILKLDGKWIQRGSEGQTRGVVAEKASLMQSDAEIKLAAQKGEQHIRVPTQNASGHGFDEARVIFGADGTARIKILEVKDYAGKYVPLADFTAINDNLESNRGFLRQQFVDALRRLQLDGGETALGMTEAQLKKALDAIDKKRFEFELRLGPETKQGSEDKGTVLKNLRESIGKKLGLTAKEMEELKLEPKWIDKSFMTAAFTETAEASFVGKTPKSVPSYQAPPAPDVTAETISVGEAALTRGKTAVAEEARVLEKESAEALALIEENKSLRQAVSSQLSVLERIEGVTGVQKGADYDKAMAGLRAFYEQQIEEAKHVVDVQRQRLDPLIGGGAYGINARFEMTEFSHGLTNVKIKVHLDGSRLGGSVADLARVERDAVAGVDKYFNVPKNHLQNGNRLHVELEFVPNPADAHLQVQVQPGRGRATQKTWFVDSDPTVHAHELGHQMGLVDEYVDPRAVNRATQTSPGVHTDDSLMADFWQKDVSGRYVVDALGKPIPAPGTALKVRHLEQMGSDIELAKASVAPRLTTGNIAAPAPLATSVDPDDLSKFSGLDPSTIAKLERLNAGGLRALGQLAQKDVERAATLSDIRLARLTELGRADPDALARIAATNYTALSRLSQLDELELLGLGQLDANALNEFGKLSLARLQHFATLDEPGLRLFGALAQLDSAAFAKFGSVDAAGLKALARCSLESLRAIAGLSPATIRMLAQLEPAALARFAALEPGLLEKFDGLSQAALQKFGQLEPVALEKFGGLRFAPVLEKYGDLPMEGLERLATLDKHVLQKFGGWDKTIIQNISGLEMDNIHIIAKLNVTPGAETVNVTLAFEGKRLQFGSDVFIIDRAGLLHILERHHPKYWDGSVKVEQSFLDPKLTVDDVVAVIETIMRQHREKLLEKGTRGMYQLKGSYKGVQYTLGLKNGRLGQLYPSRKQQA